MINLTDYPSTATAVVMTWFLRKVGHFGVMVTKGSNCVIAICPCFFADLHPTGRLPFSEAGCQEGFVFGSAYCWRGLCRAGKEYSMRSDLDNITGKTAATLWPGALRRGVWRVADSAPSPPPTLVGAFSDLGGPSPQFALSPPGGTVTPYLCHVTTKWSGFEGWRGGFRGVLGVGCSSSSSRVVWGMMSHTVGVLCPVWVSVPAPPIQRCPPCVPPASLRPCRPLSWRRPDRRASHYVAGRRGALRSRNRPFPRAPCRHVSPAHPPIRSPY